MAENELKEFFTEARMENKAREIERQVKAVRRAVEILSDCDFSTEVRDELARLPAKDRAEFTKMAGISVEELSEYLTAAADGPARLRAIAV